MATFLNTARENVNRAIDEAENAGLILKVGPRKSFTHGYTLATPRALADAAIGTFDLLDMLAPRALDVLPRGRRRDVDQRVRRADISLGAETNDNRDHTNTPVGESVDCRITPLDNRCDSTPSTDVTVGSPDSSTDLSEGEEDFSHPDLGGFFNFSRSGALSESAEEVALFPYPLPHFDGYAHKR